MKHLYYLEFARSVDSNNNPIPAKQLSWKTHSITAWEDRELCNYERICIQSNLQNHIIRVTKASLLKNVLIRFYNWWGESDIQGHTDWIIVKDR